MLIVLVLSITLIHYLWTLSVPLLPGRQASLLLLKELSQIFSLIGSLLGRGEFVCRHILINQSKPVHKIYVCRIKLTFEEDEKLLLIDRLVHVRDMVAQPPSLPPGPSPLVESPVLADLGQCHPRLKLDDISKNCIF